MGARMAAPTPAVRSWSVKKKGWTRADRSRFIAQDEVAIIEVRLPKRGFAHLVITAIFTATGKSVEPRGTVQQSRLVDDLHGAKCRGELFRIFLVRSFPRRAETVKGRGGFPNNLRGTAELFGGLCPKEAVSGVAQAGNNVAALVQALIDGGGVNGRFRVRRVERLDAGRSTHETEEAHRARTRLA